jgi:hypothetical protein
MIGLTPMAFGAAYTSFLTLRELMSAALGYSVQLSAYASAVAHSTIYVPVLAGLLYLAPRALTKLCPESD